MFKLTDSRNSLFLSNGNSVSSLYISAQHCITLGKLNLFTEKNYTQNKVLACQLFKVADCFRIVHLIREIKRQYL